jgi:hypothetical protein
MNMNTIPVQVSICLSDDVIADILTTDAEEADVFLQCALFGEVVFA